MSEKNQTIPIAEYGKLEQRLLVGVSPNQISEQLVRWTHRLASALNCWWGVVYVETSAHLPEEEQSQLTRTLALARSLGAEVITTTESNVVQGLLRTAAQCRVTQIIVGRTGRASFRRLFRDHRRLENLLRQSGELDVHVVRFKEGPSDKYFPGQELVKGSTLREYLVAALMVAAMTWAGLLLDPYIGYRAVAWIYLTLIVVMATFIGRGATLLAAALSAFLWDFVFEQPRFSFSIASAEDRVLFVMYLVISVTLGQMVARIRGQEKTERERRERATALQLLTREITAANNLDDMLRRAVQQTAEVFKTQIVMLLPSAQSQVSAHSASSYTIPAEEYQLAAWVLEQGQAAGKFTTHFPSATALYLPLAAHGDKVGVMGLALRQTSAPSIHQRNLLDAFSEQIGAVIQRHQMQQVSEKVKLVAESERLSKTLLNSISHEIRTPLAAIQSATTNMVEYGRADLSPTQQSMVSEIQEATARLNRLVGKVLDMSRLESGHTKPSMAPSEISEIVLMAEGETRKELAQHKLAIEIAPDLPLVSVDFELTLRALTNLLSNAALHTPPGTEVRLTGRVDDGAVLLVVADNGPGIPAESLPHLFEKFYRAPNARTGGTGLGLSLVKGFVEAQGGQVKAENRRSGGTAFTIRLPL
jgi:two-component system, OmpR family, sensor histidine kinase KdpD